MQICYTVCMNIFTYLQKKRIQKQEEKAYSLRLAQTKLRFPILTKIHGVKGTTQQGALAQSRAGDKLQLVHVPTEQYKFSVSVYSIPLNRLLGHLDEELCKKLVFLFGEGFCRDGEIERLTGGAPYKYIGCIVRVLDTQFYMEDCEDFSHLYSK